ncbi:DJ-1/PfpI family protein [Candidatus Peregrinibacteria bacterium]|nr:DJ-1/PfpI family protein [Candidatus Peregrinibacteria bacterium]
MRTALLVIAQNGFQDKEYAGTRVSLESAGFQIVIASKEKGPCSGKFGGTVMADIAMRDVVLREYDRIAFIGGPGAAAYASDGDALKLAVEAYRTEMPLGAICIAPTILAKAGVLEGKRATVWNEDGEQSEVLAERGAEYTGEDVTVDGTVVTANGPDAAEEFGRTLAAL